MTAATMTRDPDLDKAVVDMSFEVHQLRGLEERLCTIDLSKDYKQLARLEFEHGDVRSSIKCRAATLGMPRRTLVMFVDETERLTAKYGRRPTVQMVQNAVEAKRDWAARASKELDAAIALMEIRSRLAKEHEAAAIAGQQHIAASL